MMVTHLTPRTVLGALAGFLQQRMCAVSVCVCVCVCVRERQTEEKNEDEDTDENQCACMVVIGMDRRLHSSYTGSRRSPSRGPQTERETQGTLGDHCKLIVAQESHQNKAGFPQIKAGDMPQVLTLRSKSRSSRTSLGLI